MEENKKKQVTKEMVLSAKTKMNQIADASFDDIYNIDNEEMNEALKFDKKKKSKKMQLMAKYSHLQNQIEGTKEQYIKSLTSPVTDSVELALTMECLEKELNLTIKIHNSLFRESPIQ